MKRPVTAGAPPARPAAQQNKAAPPTSLVKEPEPPKQNPAEAAMAKMEAFKNEMCACKDADCAKKVSDEMTAWSQEQSQTQQNIRMTEADQKRATELGTAMGECMQKSMNMK